MHRHLCIEHPCQYPSNKSCIRAHVSTYSNTSLRCTVLLPPQSGMIATLFGKYQTCPSLAFTFEDDKCAQTMCGKRVGWPAAKVNPARERGRKKTLTLAEATGGYVQRSAQSRDAMMMSMVVMRRRVTETRRVGPDQTGAVVELSEQAMR